MSVDQLQRLATGIAILCAVLLGAMTAQHVLFGLQHRAALAAADAAPNQENHHARP